MNANCSKRSLWHGEHYFWCCTSVALLNMAPRIHYLVHSRSFIQEQKIHWNSRGRNIIHAFRLCSRADHLWLITNSSRWITRCEKSNHLFSSVTRSIETRKAMSGGNFATLSFMFPNPTDYMLRSFGFSSLKWSIVHKLLSNDGKFSCSSLELQPITTPNKSKSL